MKRERSNYNPYPSKPPPTRTFANISSPDKEIEFSESYVMNRSFNNGSPEKFQMKKRVKHKRYQERSLKNKRMMLRKKPKIVMIERTDYSEAYKTPDNYFIRDSKFGKIYCCPEPKMNLTHVNQDPTLGGERYRKLIPPAPLFNFNTFFNKTPRSTNYHRVIPWDDKKRLCLWCYSRCLF